ncbi:MAG TPA: TonB family protein [Longimicrobiales bacterium]
MKPLQSAGVPRFHELEAEYEIVGELGRGGTAVVYRARERELGRDVAIKVVRSSDDAEAVARLAREAKLVAALRHPNVVPLLGIKHLAEGIALIMQHVPGRTLKQAIRQDGQLPIPFVEHVLREVASALDYAHKRHGIVHRDIKPENIYLDEEVGRALLSDFGIARTTDSESNLTLVGTALGTPAYMSPEQIDGSPLDGRSDLYSLGLVAYEMLTAQQPWAGSNLYTIIYKQKNEELPPVSNFRKDVPTYLQRAVDSLLRKDVTVRCPDAATFIGLLPGVPVSAPSFTPVPREPEPVQPVVNDDSPTLRYQRPAVAEPPAVETPVLEAPVVAPAEPIAPWPAPAPIPVAPEPDPALAAVAAAMAAAGQVMEPVENEEAPVLELPTVRPNWRRSVTRGRGGLSGTAVYAQPEVTTLVETEPSDIAVVAQADHRQRNSRLVAGLTLFLVLGASGAVVAMMNGRDEPSPEEVAQSPAAQQRAGGVSLKSSGAAPVLTAGNTLAAPGSATKETTTARRDSGTTSVAALPVPNVQMPTLNPESTRSRVNAADFSSAAPMPSSAPRDVSVSDQPSFTPYTVEPELRNRDAVQRALSENYPRVLRERNVGGTVRLWVLIDTAGRVMRAEIQNTSGNDILDRAATKVANVMQFTPAMNRDKKVSVWIQLPINFRTEQ